MKELVENYAHETHLELCQVEKGDKAVEMTDGNCSWFQKHREGTYLLRHQWNRQSAPILHKTISEEEAKQIQEILDPEKQFRYMDLLFIES